MSSTPAPHPPPLTRRGFLELVARRSVGGSLAAGIVLAACRSTAEEASALGLDGGELDGLFALIDEIIPAASGMPAASEVGTVSYLELLAGEVPGIAEAVPASVRGANSVGVERFGGELAALGPTERTAAVTLFSESEPTVFEAARDLVYEAYYLDPRVWQRLGYDPYPTGGPGPLMEPFDERSLDRVRAGSVHFREVRS